MPIVKLSLFLALFSCILCIKDKNPNVIDTVEKLQRFRENEKFREIYKNHRGFRLAFPKTLPLSQIGIKWDEDPYDHPIPNCLTVNQERNRVRDQILDEQKFGEYLTEYAKTHLFPLLFEHMAKNHLLEYLGAIRKPEIARYLTDETREKIRRQVVEPWRETFGFFNENKKPIDKYGLLTTSNPNYYKLDFAFATGKWDGINPVEDIPRFNTQEQMENDLFYMSDEKKKNFDRLEWLDRKGKGDRMTPEEKEKWNQFLAAGRRYISKEQFEQEEKERIHIETALKRSEEKMANRRRKNVPKKFGEKYIL